MYGKTSDIEDVKNVLWYLGDIVVEKVDIISGGLMATVKKLEANRYGPAGEVKLYRITGDYWRHPENAEVECFDL